MVDRLKVRSDKVILRTIRKEVLRELRAEARRLRKYVRQAAPRDQGDLRRKLKVKAGWDAQGPWARVITTARRTSTSKAGKRTSFRYGLALQQKTDYLQRGLQRTPRR